MGPCCSPCVWDSLGCQGRKGSQGGGTQPGQAVGCSRGDGAELVWAGGDAKGDGMRGAPSTGCWVEGAGLCWAANRAEAPLWDLPLLGWAVGAPAGTEANLVGTSASCSICMLLGPVLGCWDPYWGAGSCSGMHRAVLGCRYLYQGVGTYARINLYQDVCTHTGTQVLTLGCWDPY